MFDDTDFDPVLAEVDQAAPYGLTGASWPTTGRPWPRRPAPRFTAGNFYLNDKPTGAVVGQQPFGGSRASGTNDKAGSMWNLIRWTSPRSIKETLVPPRARLPPYGLTGLDAVLAEPVAEEPPHSPRQPVTGWQIRRGQ